MMMTMTWLAFEGLAILAAAGLASLLLPKASASLRHLVWTAALGAIVVLPAFEASGLRIEIPVPAAWLEGYPDARPESVLEPPAPEWTTPTVPVTKPVSVELPATRSGSDEEPTPPAAWSRSWTTNASDAAPARGAGSRTIASGGSWFPVAATVWLAGVLLLLLTTLIAQLRAYGLTNGAVQPASPSVQRRLATLVLRMGLERRVRAVVSDRLGVPATWGMKRSTVVLPPQHEEWAPETVDRVLLHELAHVQRRDCWTQLLGEIARALHWPNPLAWIAVRCQRVESERACDDLVLAYGDVASAYAGDLVALVRTLKTHSPVPRAALAMAGRSGLGDRVRAILDPRRRRSAVGRSSIVVAGAIALAVAFGAAVVVPVAVAQERPELPPAPPAPIEAVAVLPEPPAVHLVLLPELEPPAEALAPEVAPLPPTQSQELCIFRDGERRSTSYHVDDDEWRIRWETDSCRVDIDMEGDVEFTSDDTGIAAMRSGSLFEIEQRIGRDRRRARFEGESGGRIERRYWVDGDEIDWGPEADRWIAQILPELFRHTTINAPARVRRMLEAGGPERVFEEVARIQSDNVGRRYLELLMEYADLSEAEYARVIEFAGELESDHNAAELLLAVVDEAGLQEAFQEPMLRAAGRLESDHQKTRVLQALLRSQLSPAQLDAVVRSAQDIESDHNLAQVLTTVVREGRLTDAGRTAFMETLETLESDHQHAMVLNAFLDAGRLTDEELTQVLAMTNGLDSDHQRAMVLQRVAMEYDLSGVQATAYLRAAADIQSDHQLAVTATTVLEQRELSSEQLELVMAMTDRMSSDHQQATVLGRVIARSELSAPEINRLLDVAEGLDSDHQLSTTLTLLIRDEELDADAVLRLLEVAGSIGSDHNLTTVLVALADRFAIEGRARELYVELAEDMSGHQRDRALAALVRAERRVN
jgi:beta-lactamase regulating signal transducer with metallopeptidase domain